MNRTDIINLIARRIDARSYLEIGVRNPAANFDSIDIASKTWVDPAGPVDDGRGYREMSSEFFSETLDDDAEFDIIFIDGDHRYEGAKFDIYQSFKHLTPGGVVVIHDILPMSPIEGAAQKPANYKRAWCGEVWRAWSDLRMWGYANGLVTFCVDTDHGVGIAYGDADHWRDDSRPGQMTDPESIAPWIDRSSYGVVPPSSAEREIQQIPRIARIHVYPLNEPESGSVMELTDADADTLLDVIAEPDRKEVWFHPLFDVSDTDEDAT